MRSAVTKHQFPAMRIYNGAAQCQPKAKASAAVTHLIFSGIEHFKYMLPALRRNAGSIILHRNPYVFFFFSGCNPDLGSCLCIFYCIVNQVYLYLYNQLCIHAGEQYVFPAVQRNFMFVFPPFYMAQRLTYYILNHLIG